MGSGHLARASNQPVGGTAMTDKGSEQQIFRTRSEMAIYKAIKFYGNNGSIPEIDES
jgi:hypothetical protein